MQNIYCQNCGGQIGTILDVLNAINKEYSFGCGHCGICLIDMRKLGIWKD